MSAAIHAWPGTGPGGPQTLLGEVPALLLFADSRPRRNLTVSSPSLPRLPGFVPLTLTPSLADLPVLRAVGHSPPTVMGCAPRPRRFRLGLPPPWDALSTAGRSQALAVDGAPHPLSCLRLPAHPAGDSSRRAVDLVWADLGARCGQRKAMLTSPFLLHSSVALILTAGMANPEHDSENVAITHGHFPGARHLACDS